MPSNTFFHLPAEKREKLLWAARQEFARVSYPDASINKMIQAAEIPRGSFYVYFQDKEDLFRYLMEQYIQQVAQLLQRLLREKEGELFAAFLALFDLMQGYIQNPTEQCAVRELMEILHRNVGMGPGMLFPAGGRSKLVMELLPLIDRSRLRLREEELPALIELLSCITAPMLGRAMISDEFIGIRERYCSFLNMIRYGCAVPTYDLCQSGKES